MSIQEAFHEVLKNAKTPECWYVALMTNVPFYGGPEEGGWWGSDQVVVAYDQFPSEELANLAAEKVEELAKQKSEEAKKQYGEHCLQQSQFLDDRGLDDDFLREPDGPEEYYVVVSKEFPVEKRGSRQYE